MFSGGLIAKGAFVALAVTVVLLGVQTVRLGHVRGLYDDEKEARLETEADLDGCRASQASLTRQVRTQTTAVLALRDSMAAINWREARRREAIYRSALAQVERLRALTEADLDRLGSTEIGPSCEAAIGLLRDLAPNFTYESVRR